MSKLASDRKPSSPRNLGNKKKRNIMRTVHLNLLAAACTVDNLPLILVDID